MSEINNETLKQLSTHGLMGQDLVKPCTSTGILSKLFPDIKVESAFQKSVREDYEREEYGCVKAFLDKNNVPVKGPDNQDYSTVGRIILLIKMCDDDLYSKNKSL